MLHFSPSGCFNQLSGGVIASVQTSTKSGEEELRGKDQNAWLNSVGLVCSVA